MQATHRPSKKNGFLGLLKKSGDSSLGMSGGGYLKYPPEFDPNKYAASWVQENDVPMMKQDQPVLGTEYSAPGWTVWKYPSHAVDEDGKKVEHPKANQAHKVDLSGVKYVLMVRSADVHAAVNEAYGAVSRDRVDAEIAGHALSVPDADKRGMITHERFQEAGHRDEEVRQIGRTVLEQTALSQGEKRIKPKNRKVKS